jgi:ribosome-associated protein
MPSLGIVGNDVRLGKDVCGSPHRMTEALGTALAAARAASSKKAESIVILDVSKQLVITDYFVICDGRTQRQVRTIAEEVERRLQETGIKPFRREGVREGTWVLLDYVDFVVHVFQPDQRAYYDLERLWADAPVVPFEDTWEERDEPATAEAT